jgi:hypothetical protein
MRSLYTHYRAPSIWSRAQHSTDPAVLRECAEQLRGYGYHEHAAQLDAKCLPLAPEVPADHPEALVKPRRAKRTKKAS